MRIKCYAINIFSIWALLLFVFPLFSKEIIVGEKESYQRGFSQQNEHVVQWARTHLPQAGVLKEAKDGFVYLKVNDDYIKQIFSMVPHSNYMMPSYFRRSDSPGAHISVFYVDERKKTGKIDEIGQKYSFVITGLNIVPPYSEEYIILEVKSLELERLREKYGLSPLLKNHEFHITIAKKKAHMRRNHY